MSRIFRVINQNSLYQNMNKEEVKNREIRYLPDLSILNLFSVFVLVQTILSYYPKYPTHRLYFWEVETPFILRNFPCNFVAATVGRKQFNAKLDRRGFLIS